MIRYKRKTKLEPTDETFSQITALAQIQCTQKEAAAVMGVAHSTFEYFLAEYPEAREAWRDGKQTGRASLRRLLWKQAQTDPSQARFLAKDRRWLQMEDKSLEVNVTVSPLSMEERQSKVLELQAKVISDGRSLVPVKNPDA